MFISMVVSNYLNSVIYFWEWNCKVNEKGVFYLKSFCFLEDFIGKWGFGGGLVWEDWVLIGYIFYICVCDFLVDLFI